MIYKAKIDKRGHYKRTEKTKQKQSIAQKKNSKYQSKRMKLYWSKLDKNQRIERLKNAHKKGKTAWNKGMRSKKYYEAEIARNSTKNSEWRKKVFERDGYSCCITGKKGGKLEVHHIFNFTDYPHLRFLLDNGITMDRDIHAEFHKLYGKKHNNLDQLLEFIKKYRDLPS